MFEVISVLTGLLVMLLVGKKVTKRKSIAEAEKAEAEVEASELGNLNEIIEIWKTAARELQQDIKELKVELVAVKNELADVRKELSEVRKENVSLKKELISVRRENALLKEQIIKLENTLTNGNK